MYMWSGNEITVTSDSVLSSFVDYKDTNFYLATDTVNDFTVSDFNGMCRAIRAIRVTSI